MFINRILPLKNTLLLLGFLLMTIHLFVFEIPMVAQWALFLATMLLTGIPHGALDHLVAEKNLSSQRKSFSLFIFLLKYINKMFLYALLWYFVPSVALLVFIAISAYHFGETDLNELSVSKSLKIPLFILYGSVLVMVLLLTHHTEVLPILQSLPNYSASSIRLIFLFAIGHQSAIIFSLVFLFLITLGISCYWVKTKIIDLLTFVFQGFVLLFICSKLPLLLAFSFYFGTWHSFLCLQGIRYHLTENQEPLAWGILIKKALLFSIVAVLGIVCSIIFWYNFGQSSDFLLGIFVGIAVLTAPHIEVMSGMFQNNTTGGLLAAKPTLAQNN